MSFERLAPEQHDALEGIPEPSENPFLAGHGAAIAALGEAHRAGRLPHGLILAGPRGIGKATLAFHLARRLFAHPDGAQAPGRFNDSDPSSPLFRQVAEEAYPSLLHLTRPFNEKGDKFKSAIGVDEVRRIGRFLGHKAHDGGYRVVIVDPADDLNTAAANALLKSLEEPPARTQFVLVTHSYGRLLPTLRSRCQAIRLAPLDLTDLIAALERLPVNLPGDAAARTELHRRSGGSVRAAILLLEHGGLEIAEALDAFAANARFDPVEAHRIADAVGGRGRDTAFELFRAHALEVLARAASASGQAGRLGEAERLSQAWSLAKRDDEEAVAFNLDRKQHALELMGRLHGALRG